MSEGTSHASLRELAIAASLLVVFDHYLQEIEGDGLFSSNSEREDVIACVPVVVADVIERLAIFGRLPGFCELQAVRPV